MRKQNDLQYEAGQAIKECSKCFAWFQKCERRDIVVHISNVRDLTEASMPVIQYYFP